MHKIQKAKINGAKINAKINGAKINAKINGAKINAKINGAKINAKINGAKINAKINGAKINAKINGAKINAKINGAIVIDLAVSENHFGIFPLQEMTHVKRSLGKGIYILQSWLPFITSLFSFERTENLPRFRYF
ncbi:hypothetical protein FSP39_001641 [Pinctada imbricata]|uniref:Uncharacterized protein n=1 Tax=Pinctada imbricata TaxID=66713 RepID=A0AA88YJL6_PINIB|nr:hypothetical protein FSP39_001641 [Pinctada imbricata]